MSSSLSSTSSISKPVVFEEEEGIKFIDPNIPLPHVEMPTEIASQIPKDMPTSLPTSSSSLPTLDMKSMMGKMMDGITNSKSEEKKPKTKEELKKMLEIDAMFRKNRNPQDLFPKLMEMMKQGTLTKDMIPPSMKLKLRQTLQQFKQHQAKGSSGLNMKEAMEEHMDMFTELLSNTTNASSPSPSSTTTITSSSTEPKALTKEELEKMEKKKAKKKNKRKNDKEKQKIAKKDKSTCTPIDSEPLDTCSLLEQTGLNKDPNALPIYTPAPTSTVVKRKKKKSHCKK